MQAGEGVYSPPPIEAQEDDPKDKKPLTIRIHLLYDGTNNNRENIAQREAFEVGEEAESESHRKYNKTISSYNNGRTNIAIMEPHITDGKGKSGYSMVVKAYIEGQGTGNLVGDDTAGLAFGVGGSGVYQRARQGITEAYNTLVNTFLQKNPPELFFIQQVDIDVFGFSRGAATARNAIHAILTEETVTIQDPSGYGAQTIVTNQPLFDRIRLYGYSEMRADKVKIIFAGLYDTVVSVNASQLAPAWLANNTRDQKAVAEAKFALHLAAADEHRLDFPLHRIKSAIDAGKGAEYYFPGVHSDIGGSYNLANEQLLEQGKEKKNSEIREVKCVGSYGECLEEKEKLIAEGRDKYSLIIHAITDNMIFRDTYRLYAYRKIQDLEYSRATSEEKIINRGRITDLVEDMKYLIEDGWYHNKDKKNPQIEIETDYLATSLRSAVSPMGGLIGSSPKSGKLVVSRHGITTAYCNIPLRYMVEHSRDMAIEIDGKLDRRITTVLDDVSEIDFDSVDASLRAYMAKTGPTGSKPSDWTDVKKAKKNLPNIVELRNKHLHMSSAYNFPVVDLGFTPRFGKNNRRRRFYYEG